MICSITREEIPLRRPSRRRIELIERRKGLPRDDELTGTEEGGRTDHHLLGRRKMTEASSPEIVGCTLSLSLSLSISSDVGRSARASVNQREGNSCHNAPFLSPTDQSRRERGA